MLALRLPCSRAFKKQVPRRIRENNRGELALFVCRMGNEESPIRLLGQCRGRSRCSVFGIFGIQRYAAKTFLIQSHGSPEVLAKILSARQWKLQRNDPRYLFSSASLNNMCHRWRKTRGVNKCQQRLPPRTLSDFFA